MFTAMSLILLASLLLSACHCAVLKVGGFWSDVATEDMYARSAFQLWKKWAMTADGTSKLAVTIELYWVKYELAFLGPPGRDEVEAATRSMTDPGICQPACVDVIVCPFGSIRSDAVISAIPDGSPIPIIVWGAASPTLFSGSAGEDAPCFGRNCFGLLTPASHDFISGLEGLSGMLGTGQKVVAMIRNGIGFNHHAYEGVEDYLASHESYTMGFSVTLSSIGELTNGADMAMVDAVIDLAPDIVLIAGNCGDVDQIIIRIARSNYRPKAIVGQNSLHNCSALRLADQDMAEFREGLLMPVQWANLPGLVDSLVGWTSEFVESELEVEVNSSETSRYLKGSAAAAALALSHAVHHYRNPFGSSNYWEYLSDQMRRVDTDSFFGHLSFNGDGTTEKPMFVVQAQGQLGIPDQVVFPLSVGGPLIFPLRNATAWDAPCANGGHYEPCGPSDDCKAIAVASTCSSMGCSWNEEQPCRCGEDYFGNTCEHSTFEWHLHDGECMQQAVTGSPCAGMAMAAMMKQAGDDCSRFGCNEWQNMKTLVGWIYDAELADIVNDFMAVFMGLAAVLFSFKVMTTGKRWAKRALLMLLIMNFFLDIGLEATIISQASTAKYPLQVFTDSNCFSRGAGYASMIRLSDTIDDILALSAVNIGIAIFGAITDAISQHFEEVEMADRVGGILTSLCAVAELGIGLLDFSRNTADLKTQVEDIEKAIINGERLKSGFVCIERNPLLDRSIPTSGVSVQPVLGMGATAGSLLLVSVVVSALAKVMFDRRAFDNTGESAVVAV